jgi:nicotinate-nucleotide adenylyltransferase
MEDFRILVYPRPGASKEDLIPHPNITLLRAPMMEISSTFIRDSVKAGKDMRYFVSSGVWEYLDKMNYYRK